MREENSAAPAAGFSYMTPDEPSPAQQQPDEPPASDDAPESNEVSNFT